MRALSIAATGMNAQQKNLEVIAHNIANINTTGFKRSRAEFSDLLYQTERAHGVPNKANGSIIPEGAHVGSGVRTAAVRSIHLQGTLASTGNRFDLAITGNGWFQIQGADGEEYYTRSGAFNTNANGELVTLDGLKVSPDITIPENVLEVVINDSGQVFARVSGQADLQNLGQITLATFVNQVGLTPKGDNLFAVSAASGEATVGVPGDSGYGILRQNYLEGSNVDPVKEITELISAQRGYEMNSKVVQAADDMASVVSNIR